MDPDPNLNPNHQTNKQTNGQTDKERAMQASCLHVSVPCRDSPYMGVCSNARVRA